MSVAEPQLQRIPMSWDDYLALPEHPRAEWVDGVVVMTPQAGYRHQGVVGAITRLLMEALPQLVTYPGGNVRLPRNRVRIPDVVVFGERQSGTFSETTPILAVEVLSPSTRGEDLLRKAPEYAEAEIDQLWLVDLEARWIEVSSNVEGRWELLERVDDQRPTAEVSLGEHGNVSLDLVELLGVT